jgi:hypothetical protein
VGIEAGEQNGKPVLRLTVQPLRQDGTWAPGKQKTVVWRVPAPVVAMVVKVERDIMQRRHEHKAGMVYLQAEQADENGNLPFASLGSRENGMEASPEYCGEYLKQTGSDYSGTGEALRVRRSASFVKLARSIDRQCKEAGLPEVKLPIGWDCIEAGVEA